MKLGLALSGGGFRASFFHLGVLARGFGPLVWAAPLGAVWLLARDARSRAALLFPLVYLAFMSLQRRAMRPKIQRPIAATTPMAAKGSQM